MNFEVCPPEPVRFHEYANLFPMLQGEALDGLREDIRQHGVREPVVFLDGAILDGRNRYMCARDIGAEYPRVEYEGNDPLGYVISHNLHRRHLTESQRAMVAQKLANLSHGGDRKSDQGANLPLEPEAPAVTVAQAAEMLSVSERSVKSARKVAEEAPYEVSSAVETGHMPVSLAAKVASLPDEAKAEVAAAPLEKMRDVAREVVKPFVANNTGNNEWYTPPAIIDAAREVLGDFDLDPASSEIANATVQAPLFYTAETDGLAQDWPIGRIWCNPPYATGLIGRFATRLAAEFRRGSTGIVLTNNATETAWFQELAGVSSAICFPLSRVRFLRPEGEAGAPLQGQAIFYSGADADGFAERFAAFGIVVRHGV
jgi:ParB family chromosome partitioning protein